MSRLSNNLVLPPINPLANALRQALANSATATSTSTDKGKSTTAAPTTAVAERTSVLKSATALVDLTFHLGDPIKPDSSKTLPGIIDPAKLAGNNKLPGTATQTLPGGLAISADPTQRPSTAELSALNPMQSTLAALLGDGALQGLLSKYGKSLDQAASLTSGSDPRASQPGMGDLIDAAMTEMQATNQYAKGDARSKYADDTSGGSTPPADGDGKKKKQTFGEWASAEWQGIKDTAAKVGDKIADGVLSAAVVISELPGAELLEAPKVLEESHLTDSFVDGVKAVAGQSGDKDPRMKQVLNDIDHVRSGDPNGDAQLAPQQQKVIDELWGRLSGGVSSATLHDRGTTLISQPVRGGDDGSFTPPSGRSLLTSTVKPVKDHSNYVNPGSGDDGNVAVTGGTGSASPRQIPGVKDPPKPGTDTDPSKPAGGTGGPTAPTGAPHNAQ